MKKRVRRLPLGHRMVKWSAWCFFYGAALVGWLLMLWAVVAALNGVIVAIKYLL